MRTILYLIFFFPFAISGQLAPDFTATDIDGQAHSLYSSYLTQPDLWIAPNPASDFLSVHAKSNPAGQVSIGVYNILGNRLHLFKPLVQGSTLILREDVSSWYPGTYLVRIESNGAVLKTMRFVKR